MQIGDGARAICQERETSSMKKLVQEWMHMFQEQVCYPERRYIVSVEVHLLSENRRVARYKTPTHLEACLRQESCMTNCAPFVKRCACFKEQALYPL